MNIDLVFRTGFRRENRGPLSVERGDDRLLERELVDPRQPKPDRDNDVQSCVALPRLPIER